MGQSAFDRLVRRSGGLIQDDEQVDVRDPFNGIAANRAAVDAAGVEIFAQFGAQGIDRPIQRGLKVGAHASSFDQPVKPASKFSGCRAKAKIPGAKIY
jgi:hypothetical protein